MGTTVLPSVKESTDTSGPSKNSSMTMCSPLAPNFLSCIICLTASAASSRLIAIITPLPKASPSAFMTVGIGAVLIYSSASDAESNTSYFAVGMPYFFMRFFENTLLPSMIAAFFCGPKQGMPFASSASTHPKPAGHRERRLRNLSCCRTQTPLLRLCP